MYQGNYTTANKEKLLVLIRGSERSRADTKERLQYLAAGTAGTSTAQGAGYGAVTDRAAVLKSVVSKPTFGVCFRLERVNRQPPIQRFFYMPFPLAAGCLHDFGLKVNYIN